MYKIDFNHPCHIYFIGIGGISMSGLAEILLEEGFQVSGSDIKPSPLPNRWKKITPAYFTGRKPPTCPAISMWSFIPARSTKITPNLSP